MGALWRGAVWAFARNTEWGKRQLGRETVLEQAARERELGRVAVGEAQLSAFLVNRRSQYDRVVRAERARGNGDYPYVELTDGWLGDQRAVVRYNLNGQRGRVEIFYGGSGPNPLGTPDDDYHGHIVMQGSTITSWLEPGPRYERNRLY